jgi:hypothetical protein
MCPRLIKNSMSVRSYVTFCRDVFSRSLSSGIRPLFALAVAVVFMDSVQAQAQTATGTIEEQRINRRVEIVIRDTSK